MTLDNKYLTKEELIAEISRGKLPDEYVPFDIGQGYGYKIDKVWEEIPDNIVIYIPEYGYEDDNNGNFLPSEDSIYTKNDFREVTEGHEGWAEALFNEVDWQFPETLWDVWAEWEEVAD